MAAHVGPLEDEEVLEKRAEDRNPARHNAEQYFAGSVEQAIAECRSKRSLLVVFLKGGDEESYTADETLHVSLGWLEAKHIVALRLHDDLSNTNPKAFRKAKAFREIFPNIRELPFLMLLAPDGKPLGSLLGSDVSTLAAEAIEHAHDMLVAQQALPPEPAAARPTLPSQPQVAPATTFMRPPGPTSAAPGNPNASTLAASNSASALGGVPSTDITQLTSALMSASQQAAQAAAVHGSLAAQQQNSRALPAGTAPAQPQPQRQLPRPTAGGIGSVPTAPPAAAAQTAAALAQDAGGRAAEAQSSRSDRVALTGGSARQRTDTQPAASSSSAAAAVRRPTTSPTPAAAASAVTAPVLAAQQEARMPQAVPPRTAPTPPAGPVASGSPGVDTATAAESADRIAHLSFRLTDGSMLRADFPADASLQSVFRHIAQHRTDGAVPYRLRTPSVPYRFLDAADAERTLHSLDLCPRSLLVLQPSDGGGSVLAGGNGLAGAIARLRKNVQSWLVSLVIIFIGFFAGMFSSTAGRQQPIEPPQQPTTGARRQPPTAPAADRNAKGTATAFKGGQVFQGSKDTVSSLYHRNHPDKGKE